MLMIILAIVLTVAVLHFLFNCDPEVKPREDGVYFLGARWWAEKTQYLVPKRRPKH